MRIEYQTFVSQIDSDSSYTLIYEVIGWY